MKSEQYWAQRMEQLNEAQLQKGEAFVQRTNEEYEKAIAKIQKDVDTWYARLAKNNVVSMAEARKLLQKNELKEFRWTVDEYIKAGRENAVDQRWMKELENASAKVHINRLEALQTQMRHHVEVLTAKRQQGTSAVLGGIYKDNYYRSIFELQKGAGLGSSFAKLDTRQLENLLVKPWTPDGSNFSSRIWADRTKLVSELNTTLVQGLIRGDSSDKMITQIAERMGVSRSRAENLVLTESAYFSGASRRAAYNELGVEKFQNIATLDKRTSNTCRTMDKTIFLLSEAQPNVNCAPFHGRCRTVDIPYYEDNVKERAARGDDGKTYDVPGDTTYAEWAKEHAPADAKKPPREKDIQPTERVTDQIVGSVEEPLGFNRRYNPKASYYTELPNLSGEAAEKLADINRELARVGSKTGREMLVALDRETGEEIGRISGSKNKVTLSDELNQRLHEATLRSVILTHNHPAGTRVNVKDAYNLSIYQSISDIVAVGHDGGISFVNASRPSIDDVALLKLIREIFLRVEVSLQTDREYVMMSKTAQSLYKDYLVLQEIVSELGWTYGEDFKATKDYPRI